MSFISPPGSYKSSCRNIIFEGIPGETECYIIALCQKEDGSWVESRLKYDIANINGKLTWCPDSK
ncbi:hypothetical protein [Pseudoalteromonas luteoviolacea]|uniref:Cyanovirin-N domain-containing protein n=1 Tax=Pseudoalteromonas luteoviolacea DSM 6061 TaxID=1365250 RepID=A0A166XWB6_9GAMM|nr:hypothetical protein [Pseudoalteromonas luteoviolacea]KZN40978.1 hypothetical protein N475_00960 [Pseudoalteromonas luteoviolacea DSM 6061]KZN56399.1 hypothetical protein N474_11680 [Pseudoalteromonas luteoviolacea CPMOR-2]MBE0386302.1 CVNH domain protein [Pseudoalteromonas luteoviolacea DSM 6061]TQF71184.1 hypothetical protein FLM44_08870 [Pseudoalteromonas luteoviolacea]